MSTHSNIVRTLGIEIVGGVYQPGDNLPLEADLLKRFGVSRTALREAIKTLSAKGLLIAKTRVGTRVADIASWNYFDPDVLSWRVEGGTDAAFRESLAEVRRALEPTAASLAAKRRSPEDLAVLHACVEAMRGQTASAIGFARADLDLHLAIGAASKNPMIRSMASVIETALLEAFTLSPPVRSPELHRETVESHALIVDRIEAGDGPGAAAAMLAVIDAGVARIARETAPGSGRDRETN